MIREIVLPSGKFASIARITWRDWLFVQTVIRSVPTSDLIVLLAEQCVRIDGAAITYAELLDLDIQDALVLFNTINRAIAGPSERKMNNPCNPQREEFRSLYELLSMQTPAKNEQNLQERIRILRANGLYASAAALETKLERLRSSAQSPESEPLSMPEQFPQAR